MEEHQPVGESIAAEPRLAGSTATDDPLADPRALQILTTEHWSLLASRSLAYNEAFSRSGMFLSFLSATLIVMGFLVASSAFSGVAVPITAIMLLADLFIGLATLGRLIDASSEELQCVRGMNRIRHAYREIVPGLEPYFVAGFHDDARGVLASYGYAQRTAGRLGNVFHGMTTTIGMIGTIDALIFGALLGVMSIGLGLPVATVIVAAVVGFIATLVVLARVGMRFAFERQASVPSVFPTPD